jgi:hypothetical protein
VLGVRPALDDVAVLELLEACGEHAGRQPWKGFGEILKAPGAMQKEVAEEEEAPAVADDVEGAGNGTVESVRLCHGRAGLGEAKDKRLG